MPAVDVVVVRSEETTFTVSITTRRLHVVEMRSLALTLHTDNATEDLAYAAAETDDNRWLTQRPVEPLTVRAIGQTSLVVVWRGELWPKFSVTWAGNFDDGPITSETLGNKLVLWLSG